MMDRDGLKNELVKLSSGKIVWFAMRCAIRTVPVLADRGETFPYWQSDTKTHIFSVFRSLNASIALCEKGHISSAYVASSAAYAAAVDADSAATASFYSSSAVAAASAAAYAASAAISSSFAAASAAAANAAVYATSSAANAAALEADLTYLKTDSYKQWPSLWPSDPPTKWSQLVESLLSGLRNLGLDYWATECSNWLSGRFDEAKHERCLFMPQATVKAGPEAMLVYLQAVLVRTAEARVVFLGEGEAGKTSLIRCLFNEKIRGDEPATPKIEIRQRLESFAGSETRVHYWDFGGQVIMHATHQFFLREKSVYVVVLDIRRSDSLEYWLDHVRVFASGAPTLIVLNKVDSLPTGMAVRTPFDLKKVRAQYSFVVDAVFPLSCKTKKGLEAFAAALRTEIADNHILRPDMPEKWFQIKEALTKENKNFIHRHSFDLICQSKGVTGAETAAALTVFDILGVAIHFPKLPHHDVVLNPEWITKAIYAAIWSSENRHLNGNLNAALLKNLFADARNNNVLDVDVPDEKCDFILELMSEFKLAFRNVKQEGEYCIPMLAPTDEPNHKLPREGGRQFVFSLPFLPPGLFYRFIAEWGSEIADTLIWKNGAVLAQGETRVLVEYSEYRRSITLIAHGPGSGAYLTILRQRLMKLLGESYKELDYEPYVITPDGERLNWREMTKRYTKEGATARIYTDRNEYPIGELMKEFFGDLGKELKRQIELEFDLIKRQTITERNHIIQVNPTFTTTISPHFTQENKMIVNVHLQPLIQVDSALQMAKEKIDDFKEDQKEEAAKHAKELQAICREIKRLHDDIAEYIAQPETAEAKKQTIMQRINERWTAVAEGAKQVSYVTAMIPYIKTAANWISKIDWANILR